MEKSVVIDGLELFYEVTGPEDGNPVILMHGWGCNHATVRSIASALDSHMRVYNIDLPGHGKSEEPKEIWGVRDFSGLIEKFISINKIVKPSLIGHSFGGRISIILGAENDIDKIVLVDSAGIKPKRSFSYYRKVYSYKLMKILLPLILGKKKSEGIISRQRDKRSSDDYRNSSPVMRGVMSRCVNEDLKKYMPDIKSSVLLIWGENDTATPLKDAEIMKSLIPDSGLVSFPGCGHYSFLDNPYGFRKVIQNFFNI